MATFFNHQVIVKAASQAKVFVNGHIVAYDVHPQNIKGRVMVLIRKTVEFLNADVLWSNKERKVTVYDHDKKIELFVNQYKVKVNGREQKIDSVPIIHESRVLLPVRFLSEILDYDVKWKSSTQSVLINEDDIKIPILMYHHFFTKKVTSLTVHPTEFFDQLKYLKSIGYETITDHDIVEFMKGNIQLPEKPIMITMDDGYESNYNYAYPVLKKLDLKGTIYVIGSKIRKDNDSPYATDAIPKISWEQAREMYESGVMEIQSHTYNMHKKALTKSGKSDALIKGPVVINGKLETKIQYETRVIEDLSKNKRLIEDKVGNKVISLAYPYGMLSESSEKLLKNTGHQLSLSVNKGINRKEDGPFVLNRINVLSGMTGQDIQEEIQELVKE